MKRNFIRIIILFLIAIFIASSVCYVSAAITDTFTGKNMTGEDSGKKIVKIISIVLEVVRNVGAGLAVLMMLVLGCKYILASASDRADIKKHAVTYVIGALVLFASSGIAGILKEFATSAMDIT